MYFTDIPGIKNYIDENDVVKSQILQVILNFLFCLIVFFELRPLTFNKLMLKGN